MRFPDWRKQRRLQNYGGQAAHTEHTKRLRVQDFITGLRTLCEEEGPEAFRHLVEASEDASLRQIAYLLVWQQGPKLEVWEYAQAFDAVDLLIDAAAEGFEAHVPVASSGA